ALEDVQHLQDGEALSGRRQLEDLHAAEGGRDGVHPLRLAAAEVGRRQEPSRSLGPGGDVPCDAPLVEGIGPLAADLAIRPREVQERGPSPGICENPLAVSALTLACCGARPLASRPNTRELRASQTCANKSPPMPHDIGSTTPSMAFAAMAASTAVPPRFSIS